VCLLRGTDWILKCCLDKLRLFPCRKVVFILCVWHRQDSYQVVEPVRSLRERASTTVTYVFSYRSFFYQTIVVCQLPPPLLPKRVWSGHSLTVAYVTSKPTASDKRCWSDKIMPPRVHSDSCRFCMTRLLTMRCFQMPVCLVWTCFVFGRSAPWTCPSVCRRRHLNIRGFREVKK
jgi:hypothetical protein